MNSIEVPVTNAKVGRDQLIDDLNSSIFGLQAEKRALSFSNDEISIGNAHIIKRKLFIKVEERKNPYLSFSGLLIGNNNMWTGAIKIEWTNSFEERSAKEAEIRLRALFAKYTA